MVDRPKATVALLSLALAAGLVACSSGSGQGGPGADGSQSSTETRVGDDFPKRNVLVTAVCSPGNGGNTVIRVDGWDPQSFKHMAQAEFRLPETAVIASSNKRRHNTAVEQLCDPGDWPPNAGDVAAIRSLFDQDFTKMAVVTEDPQTAATHVGYVDRSGKYTDLTGNQDFGETPHEDNAAFARDGSEVWFTYEVVDKPGISTKGRIATRALAGDHKVVDRLELDYIGGNHLITVGTGSRAVLARSAHLSPDGKHLLAEGQLVDPPAEGQAVGGDDLEPRSSISCDGGGRVGWLDNDTVLCDAELTAEQRFAAIDITPGAKPGAPIVPSNDHKNYGMVISPDGQKFVFLSLKGSAQDYFLSDTKPGSTPKKIERTGEFSTLGDTAVFIDWR